MTFEPREWERRAMSVMNPEMDYAAPEIVIDGKFDTYADVYSYGVLAYALFNENKPAVKSGGSIDTYRRSIEKVRKSIRGWYMPDIYR